MRLSLRYRLLGPLLVVLAGDVAATAWAARSAALRAERGIADQLHAVAGTLTEPPTFPLSPRILDQMKGLSGAEFILIRGDGTRIGTLQGDVPPRLPDAVTSEGLLGTAVEVGGAEYRGLEIALRHEPNTGGTLVILYPESARATAIREATRPYLWLGGLGALVALGVVAGVGGRLVTRIRTLEQQTRTIAGGNFTPLPLPSSDDEIRDLYQSVNEMARRLHDLTRALQSAERLRLLGQLGGGLAHQLRNSASGARLAIQLHREECPALDRESLDVALRQLDRLEASLRQFLTLGKPTDGPVGPVDLSAIVSQAVDLAGPRCRHADVAIRLSGGDLPMTLQGEPEPLEHLVGNLLDNAIDAAGPGGHVSIALSRDASGMVLKVCDSGPGPSAELAEHLFEPFVTGKPEGVGLGLAVAQQASQRHGATLSWHRDKNETVFQVRFPLPRS